MYSITPADFDDHYIAKKDRYSHQTYVNIGPSGLKTSRIALGLWQGFSAVECPYDARAMIHRAFDLGINHFDLGNNYGRPPGSAETFLGTMLIDSLKRYRNELIISTKAGYDMWPGPLGTGSSKKYLTASLDDSLKRLKLDYVDIFYSHRFDNQTPLWETAEALCSILDQGKALYIGVSSYDYDQFVELKTLMATHGKRIIVNQCHFSVLSRWPKERFFGKLTEQGAFIAAFSPLAQGLLTDKYANGDSLHYRSSMTDEYKSSQVQKAVSQLKNLASDLQMNLTELSLKYVLSHSQVPFMTIGATRVHQIDNICGLSPDPISPQTVSAMEAIVKDVVVDIWPRQ